jgi:hypothetical protein
MAQIFAAHHVDGHRLPGWHIDGIDQPDAEGEHDDFPHLHYA